MTRGLLFLLAAAVGCAFGAAVPDSIYTDHMVLQRGVSVCISGTADSAEPVVVEFAGQSATATPHGGTWRVELQPMDACVQGKTLSITQGSARRELHDVVVGEVWLASGQSNMEFHLKNEAEGKQAIAAAGDGGLRIFYAASTVPTPPGAYNDAQRDLLRRGDMYRSSWQPSTPESVPEVSAVAYYFARELRAGLGADVPVGLVCVSNGGSEMAAWLPQDSLQRLCPEALGNDWLNCRLVMGWARMRGAENMNGDPEGLHPYRPGFLFRTGIVPWLGYPISGVIWYQGETDSESADMAQHTLVMTELITSWQRAFHHPQMPFLMVQLPHIAASREASRHWPQFRRVQQHVADAVPGAAAVVTLDLGTENEDVHPPRKAEVGRRLARTALGKVYGLPAAWQNPRITGATREAGALHLSLNHADDLHTTDGKPPVGFELAGKDGVYRPAHAEIRGGGIILTHPDVPRPQKARYGWAIMILPNVVNAQGLPLAPWAPQD